MHAAEGPQRVDRAVSSPLSIISLGDVGGDGGVTDQATRGFCSGLVVFVPLAPWSAGGGDREDVALSYVYADSGCVAARWLCVL